jgi:hypothetical protein
MHFLQTSNGNFVTLPANVLPETFKSSPHSQLIHSAIHTYREVHGVWPRLFVFTLGRYLANDTSGYGSIVLGH